jgi:hypothetical protein
LSMMADSTSVVSRKQRWTKKLTAVSLASKKSYWIWKNQTGYICVCKQIRRRANLFDTFDEKRTRAVATIIAKIQITWHSIFAWWIKPLEIPVKTIPKQSYWWFCICW